MADYQMTISPASFEMGTPVTVTIAPGGFVDWNQCDTITTEVHFPFVNVAHALIFSAYGSPTSWTGTWNFPVSVLAPNLTGASSGTGEVYVRGYIGGNLREYAYATFTAIVPASVAPVLSPIRAYESAATANVAAMFGGRFVQGLSAPSFQVDVTPAYGSSVASVVAEVNGVAQYVFFGNNQFSIDLPILSTSAPLVVVFTVTDRRGHRGTATTTIDVLPYVGPRVTNFTVERCDIDGTLKDIGTYVKIITAGVVSPSPGEVTEGNQLTSWALYSRLAGESDWGTPIKNTPAATGISWASTDILGAGGYSAIDAYEFLLDCRDQFCATLSIVTLATGTVTMSWSRTGVGVNKVWQQGALDVGGDAFVAGDIVMTGDIFVGGVLLNPAAVIKEYAGAILPVGHLWCDGASYLRTDYLRLFVALGGGNSPHGLPDGNHFNVPNRNGRVAVGVGTATGAPGATAHTLGQVGGEETHALTGVENGPHTHALGPGESFGVNFGANSGATTAFALQAQSTNGASYQGPYSAQSSGSGTPHNNLPPYVGMNFIITT